MSLSSLNSPVLTSLAGITLHLITPKLEELALDPNLTSLTTLQWANAVSYAIQVIAVSLPGRIDGEVAKEMMKEEKEAQGKKDGSESSMEVEKTKSGDDSSKKYTPIGGRTLVSPAGWAFAIWGPIFLGEFIFVSSQFRIASSDGNIASLLRQVSLPFSLAQVYQSLWCATFRPKYKKYQQFISAGFLTSVAYSLSKAHKVYATSSKPFSSLDYMSIFLPIGMHFGWTTAASLVNFNGAISSVDLGLSSATVALVGHASAIGASILGMTLSITRNAPVYGSVIAWALKACADGMKRRLNTTVNKKKKDGEDEDGYNGVENQWWLCTAGAVLNVGTALFFAGRQLFLK